MGKWAVRKSERERIREEYEVTGEPVETSGLLSDFDEELFDKLEKLVKAVTAEESDGDYTSQPQRPKESTMKLDDEFKAFMEDLEQRLSGDKFSALMDILLALTQKVTRLDSPLPLVGKSLVSLAPSKDDMITLIKNLRALEVSDDDTTRVVRHFMSLPLFTEEDDAVSVIKSQGDNGDLGDIIVSLIRTAHKHVVRVEGDALLIPKSDADKRMAAALED